MKKIGFTILALTMLLAATGCTGNGQTNLAPESTPTAANGASNTGGASEEKPTVQPSGAAPGEQDTGGQEGEARSEGAADAEHGAEAAVKAFKEKDMDALKQLIHPDKGILFSPYGHVDTKTALVFKRSELPSLQDETVYVWGSFDGSGEPIELTFRQYLEQFVYDKDFAQAEQIGVNEIKGSGNSMPNIEDIFPDSRFVDHYFSGFEEQYAGMDWASLIIVLEEHQGSWYVVAAIHNQWTI